MAFARFRFGGRLFFGVVIQAAMTLIVWLVTLPFEFYLNTLDWTMLALLLPALAAMLSILLANAFEFTEVVWQKHWQRHFRPERPSLDAVEPCVSIHLPCHNEPPEMVIQTLASLARMRYHDFEVLVIDNNTKNEDVWKPVERYVERLEQQLVERFGADGARPRFRFFHLDNWPGFKAGALNFALRETDPRADVVGVVDADYVVDPDWLRLLYAHFEAPRVAVVQCPQAHRDWESNAFQRMSNWEYDGFFRIGMHHRNERDAIIQHGTMTLVRKRALVETGGWSEWCICEDAELGLRLMNAGWETRYVDEVLGRGLTPSNFSGYKSQRFRWAFGAMQILKRRWNWLWGRQDAKPIAAGAPRPPGLTPGQRFHFLTGWFSWFADALHLFFTLASLGWTVGMLLNPENFSLPLDLFVIPVLGFFVLKAYFGSIVVPRAGAVRLARRDRGLDRVDGAVACHRTRHHRGSGAEEGHVRRHAEELADRQEAHGVRLGRRGPRGRPDAGGDHHRGHRRDGVDADAVREPAVDRHPRDAIDSLRIVGGLRVDLGLRATPHQPAGRRRQYRGSVLARDRRPVTGRRVAS